MKHEWGTQCSDCICFPLRLGVIVDGAARVRLCIVQRLDCLILAFMHTVRVWDLPLRLFHWSLVGAVLAMVSTASLGWMEWHIRCGYLLSALLLFRLVWGVVGGHWARFASFVPRPRALIAYLRGDRPALSNVGHNPLGALSVIAMLLTLSLQVCSGLASDDEIAASGPLARHLASSWVAMATAYHTNVGKYLLLALVALHVGAIARYQVLGQDLVRPMLSGDKLLHFPAPSSRDDMVTRWVATACFVLCLGAVLAAVHALE